MKTYEVRIESTVLVTVDESKFTPEFMEAYRDAFYDHENIEEHVKSLAEWRLRGVIQSDCDFQEGYGPLVGMGIKTRISDMDVWEPVPTEARPA